MNILVDRHHAGLFHSLQLLFEDRLGYTVYTPIGHEWWDEGYWRFGEVFGDDRLARQYLQLTGWQMEPENENFDFSGQEGITYDPEFPERPIHGMRVAQAWSTNWDAVLASVQENQRGFARFAAERGAKYLYHVGNTNQQIDWSLDPRVLNCSEMPMLGRHADIGEEFDSEGMFGFSDMWAAARPGDTPNPSRASVASFVNCMPEICADHGYIREAVDAFEANLPLSIHGISGPAGNIKPISHTAQIMRTVGWALHDKPQGDGYGHVIHMWAAIGRPLIGHASHYRGKNASVFWRDLETCIDLDRHPIEEAIRLVREISADPPRHEAMCRAIRNVFDATTNWEADAAKVRELIA